MATFQPDKSRNLIDNFLRFLKRIALEIVKEDIELAIFLIDEKLPQEKVSEIKKAAQPGVVLVSCLKEYRLLSENNLDFFIELLKECRRVDLANKVLEYQKSVKTVKNTPPAQIDEKLPAHNMESLSLVMPGQPSSISAERINQVRGAICSALGFKQSEVFYVTTNEDEENSCYSQMVFQLQGIEEKINKLQMDALNKEPWLTALEVVELTVDKKSSVKIAEKKQGDVPKMTRNGKTRSRPPVARIQSVLGLDPCLKIHCNHTFDTILAIEMSPSVDVKKRQVVLKQCEDAMKMYHSHQKESISARLAAIRFGNHSVVPVRLPEQQHIAFLEKELSHDLKITSHIKPDADCGGSKTSGLADVLSMVYSQKDNLRREATKLSIVICFINSNSANLEHYRCSFGYDVIDLGHALATHAIPLYIIGIDLGRRQSFPPPQENYLLSGLTAITGGRYFQIQDISLLKELIRCIIKENNSIENNMGAVNDIVIKEIDKQYGDVNDVHLTEYLHNSLCLRSCVLDCISQRRMLLLPISRISERVSWADNLDDAIAGVKSLEEHLKAADEVPIPSRHVPRTSMQSPTSEAKKTTKGKCKSKEKEPKEFANVRMNPDMEVSARMVRRQIERSAYYRPTTEKC